MKTLAFCALALIGCDSGDDGNEDTTLGEGDLYPAITIEDCDGNPKVMQTVVAEHDVTYITFAAQWCTACAEEAPRIEEELVEGLAGKSVGIIQILVEQGPGQPPADNLCTAWKTDLGTDFDVWVDLEQQHLLPFFGATEAGTLPVHLIVTRDGVIQSKIVGALPTDIKQRLEAFLPAQ